MFVAIHVASLGQYYPVLKQKADTFTYDSSIIELLSVQLQYFPLKIKHLQGKTGKCFFMYIQLSYKHQIVYMKSMVEIFLTYVQIGPINLFIAIEAHFEV